MAPNRYELNADINLRSRVDGAVKDLQKAVGSVRDDLQGLDKQKARPEIEIRGTDSARKEVNSVSSPLKELDGSKATASVQVAGADKAQRDIRRTKSAHEELDGAKSELLVVADAGPAIREMRSAKREHGSLDGRVATLEIEADSRPAMRETRSAKREHGSLDGRVALLKIDADAVPAEKEMRGADRAHDSLDGKVATLEVDADVGAAIAGLKLTERERQSLSGKKATLKVDLDGAAGAVAGLRAVEREREALSGKDVEIPIDRNSLSRISALRGGMVNLGESVDLLQFAIRAVGANSMPMMITAIGGGIPTVSALGTAVVSLGGAMSQALVGGAAAATGAIGAFAAGAGLLVAPIAMNISALGKYEKSLDKSASAQSAVTSAAKTLANAERSAAQSAQGVADARQSAAEGVANAEKAYADALDGVRDAQRGVKDAERGLHDAQISAAEGVASAEKNYREALEGVADAARGVKDAERGLHEAQEDAARGVAAAQEEYRDSLRGVEDAEDGLRNAREDLNDSTRDLRSAQDELNDALREEPLNQREATLDLADARDRASDAQRDYNEAVKEYGRNSEEATDASRSLERAQIDLERTEGEVRETRRKGSEELRGAQEGLTNASKREQDARGGVKDAEEALADAREEAAKSYRGIAEAEREGNKQIAQAQRGLADAQRAYAKAQENAADAQAGIDKARQQGAREVADAQQALVDSQQNVLKAMERADDAQAEIENARQAGARQIADALSAQEDAQRAVAEAAQALADAQSKASEETVKLSAAQMQLYDAYQRFKKVGAEAFQPATDAMALLGVRALGLAERALPRLGRASLDTTRQLERVFGIFERQATEPRQLLLYEETLRRIPRIFGQVMEAATNFGIGAGNVFLGVLPYSERMTKSLVGITRNFREFTQSTNGQNSIDDFFNRAYRRAGQFLTILKDTTRGIYGFGTALMDANLDEFLVKGLMRGARAFREVSAAGSQSRKNITEFANRIQPLLSSIRRATTDWGKEFLSVTNRLSRDRNMRTLTRIFDALGDSASLFGDTVVEAFQEIGPYLPRLITSFAGLFRTFAAYTPVFANYIDFLSRMFTWFNKLPDPIKNTAANLAATSLAIKTVTGAGPAGLAGLASGAAGSALQLSYLGQIAGVNEKNLGGFAGAVQKVGRPMGLFGGASKTATGNLLRFGAALAIGGVVLGGLALLGGALVTAYNKNEKFHDAVNRLGGRATKVFGDMGRDLKDKWGPPINRALNGIADKIVDIFDLDKGQKNKIEKHGKGAGRAAYKGANDGIKDSIKRERGEGTASFELGFTMGDSIRKGLRSVFSGSGEDGGGGGVSFKSIRKGAVKVLTYQPPWIRAGKEMAGEFLKGLGESFGIESARKAFKFLTGGLVQWIGKQMGRAGGAAAKFFNDHITDGLDGLDRRIKRSLKRNVQDPFDDAMDSVGRFARRGVDRAGDAIMGLPDRLRRFGRGVKNAVVDPVVDAMEDAGRAARRGIDRTGDFIMGLPRRLRRFGGNVMGAVLDPFRDIYDRLVGRSIVPDTVNSVVRLFTGMPGRVLRGMRGFVKDVRERFDEIKDAIVSKVDNASDKAGKRFDNWRDTNSKRFGNFAGNVRERFNDIRDNIVSKVDNASDKAGNRFDNWRDTNSKRFGNFSGNVRDRFNDIRDNIVSKVDTASDKAGRRFDSWRETNFNRFKSWAGNNRDRFNEIRDDITSKVDTASDKAGRRFDKWRDSNFKGFKSFGQTTKDRFNQIRDDVTSKVDTMADRAGRRMEKFRNAASDRWRSMWNRANEFGGNFRDILGKRFGEAFDGTSKWIKKIGGVVADILDYFGADSAAKKLRGASGNQTVSEDAKVSGPAVQTRADGGVFEGNKPVNVQYMARGGISGVGESLGEIVRDAIYQGPEGGMSDGLSPQVVVYGEKSARTGKRAKEAYVREDGSPQEQIGYLTEAARWFGLKVGSQDNAPHAHLPEKAAENVFRQQTMMHMADGGMFMGVDNGYIKYDFNVIPYAGYPYSADGRHKGVDIWSTNGGPFKVHSNSAGRVQGNPDWSSGLATAYDAQTKDGGVRGLVAGHLGDPLPVGSSFGPGDSLGSTIAFLGDQSNYHVHWQAYNTPIGSANYTQAIPPLMDPKKALQEVGGSIGVPSKGGGGGGGGFDVMGYIKDKLDAVKALSLGSLGEASKLGAGITSKVTGAATDYLVKKAEEFAGTIANKLGGILPGDQGGTTPFKGDWATAKGGGPEVNRGIGKAAAEEIGWGGQWDAWNELGRRESGWDRFAKNSSSGAYGIPQALPESKLPAAGQSGGGSHAGPQVAWMADYIKERYTDPQGAVSAHDAQGWYTNGGIATKPHKAVVADKGDELFIPLHDPQAVNRFVGLMEGVIENESERKGKFKDNQVAKLLEQQLDLMKKREPERVAYMADGGVIPPYGGKATRETRIMGEVPGAQEIYLTNAPQAKQRQTGLLSEAMKMLPHEDVMVALEEFLPSRRTTEKVEHKHEHRNQKVAYADQRLQYADQTTPQGWDLESGGKIGYSINSRWAGDIQAEIDRWNALGNLQFVRGGSDMNIMDGSLESGIGGRTYSDGRVYLSSYYFPRGTMNFRRATIGHELGHARGHPHRFGQSIMHSPAILNSSNNYSYPQPYDISLDKRIWGGYGRPSGGDRGGDRGDGGRGGGGGGSGSTGGNYTKTTITSSGGGNHYIVSTSQNGKRTTTSGGGRSAEYGEVLNMVLKQANRGLSTGLGTVKSILRNFGISSFDTGGLAMKPQFARVAENGPELFLPLDNENVVTRFVSVLGRAMRRSNANQETGSSDAGTEAQFKPSGAETATYVPRPTEQPSTVDSSMADALRELSAQQRDQSQKMIEAVIAAAQNTRLDDDTIGRMVTTEVRRILDLMDTDDAVGRIENTMKRRMDFDEEMR